MLHILLCNYKTIICLFISFNNSECHFKKKKLSKHLKLSECKANTTIEFMACNFKILLKIFWIWFCSCECLYFVVLWVFVLFFCMFFFYIFLWSILTWLPFFWILTEFLFKTSLLQLKAFFPMVLIQAFRF